MSIVDAELDVLTAQSKANRPAGGSPKRIFDATAASALLLFLLPLLGFVCLLVFLLDRGPIFFGHERIGYNGRRFRCLKFRSMVPNSQDVLKRYLEENPGAREEWESSQKLRNDPRITRIGKFLRETSIDELPQLINVIRGDMSLVGPRPIVKAEAARYAGEIGAYVSARPGITGLWQVSGRSDVDYERRVELDTRYVTNCSLFNDIKILFKTVSVVFSRAGSY